MSYGEYFHFLLSISDEKLSADFGLPFVSAWRITHNFQKWKETGPHPAIDKIASGSVKV